MPDEGAALATVTRLLREVVGEAWIEERPITRETSFNADLELESIEFVALAEKLQGEYGREVDFVAWLSQMELDEILGLTVGDVVEFIAGCRSS
jgi:acyl carrier protein